ncbi:MAG: STAS domain-containing protein [Ignavibacteriaceae bacterium]
MTEKYKRIKQLALSEGWNNKYLNEITVLLQEIFEDDLCGSDLFQVEITKIKNEKVVVILPKYSQTIIGQNNDFGLYPIVLDKLLEEILKLNYKYLIFSMNNIINTSDIGLSVISKFIEQFKERNGDFILCNITASQKNIFDLLRINEITKLYDTVIEAIEYLNKKIGT